MIVVTLHVSGIDKSHELVDSICQQGFAYRATAEAIAWSRQADTYQIKIGLSLEELNYFRLLYQEFIVREEEV